MPTVTEGQTFLTGLAEGALPKGRFQLYKALLICWGYHLISFDTLLGEAAVDLDVAVGGFQEFISTSQYLAICPLGCGDPMSLARHKD